MEIESLHPIPPTLARSSETAWEEAATMAAYSGSTSSPAASEPQDVKSVRSDGVPKKECHGNCMDDDEVFVGHLAGHTRNDQRDMDRMGKQQELIVWQSRPFTFLSMCSVLSTANSSTADVPSHVRIELCAYSTGYMGVYINVC